MKVGDLVYDTLSKEMVMIVEKLSNTVYQCFSPKSGSIEIYKKALIPQTPNNKLIKQHYNYRKMSQY